MDRRLLLVAVTATSASLLACATPEELAQRQQRATGSVQTGSNIVRNDGRGRADAVTDKDAQDSMLNDMRNTSYQSLSPKPPGG